MWNTDDTVKQYGTQGYIDRKIDHAIGIKESTKVDPRLTQAYGGDEHTRAKQIQTN